MPLPEGKPFFLPCPCLPGGGLSLRTRTGCSGARTLARPYMAGEAAALAPAFLHRCRLSPSQNDRSHWGKVKVLINRITRKSIRASEPSPFGESAVDSRHCR